MKNLTLIILAIVALGICTSASDGNVKLRLGPEGEILGWLVAGPFPNPSDKEFKDCKGFETDYLGGETSAKPVEGQEASSAKWQLAVGDAKKGIDFLPIFKPREPAVAYAYATLTSKSPMDVRLLIGSDDGVKVWLNGKLVHTNHVTRGVEGSTDEVDIRLNSGANRLLLKVDQHFGGWGLKVQVVGADLVEVLDVQPRNATGAPTADSLIRASAGKEGSLDLDSAVRYNSLVVKAEMWMPWLQENDDKAKPMQQSLKLWRDRIGATSKGDVDIVSGMLAEAAQSLEQGFDTAFAEFTSGIQDPKPLIKAKPANEDYVRVAPGGKYFVHADGKFFTPLGYNHNPEWPQTIECAIGTPDYDPLVTDAFFKHLHECGVNLIRMMLEAPAIGFLLEDPVGTFKPEQVAFLDNFIRLAGQHDIKLMITPWDTFWMGHTWDTNPWNVKNGGPVTAKIDFITKREAIEAQKKRWEFVIDRWGNTGTVFAWELLNEADLWWEASPEQVAAWAKDIGDFVRQYEKQKWGRNHLICISIAVPAPENNWKQVAYAQPGMDLATTHLYLDAANAPDEAIGPALAIRRGVTYALSQIKDGRPYIDGEDGPINRWISDQRLDDEVFHNMTWAHLASGGAGSGLRWPYRFPHHLSEGMYQHLGRMSKFVKDVPWAKLIGTPAEMKVAVHEGWVACSTATSKGALVWVAAPKPSEMKLSISWNGPETVKYRCYDTKSGEWIGDGTTKVIGGAFSIPIAGERMSVVVILE